MELTECIACQYGAHEDHTEVIEACPEGMMGGTSCPCKGECRDRPSRTPAFTYGSLPDPPDFASMLKGERSE